MQLSKWETIALFILVGLILLGVIALRMPHQAVECGNHYAHDQQTQEGPLDLNTSDRSRAESDLRAQWTMAYGTIALFSLTLIAIWFSNRASAKALNETKRSNQVLIDMERGMLILTNIHGREKMIGFPVITIENIGRTLAIVIDSAFDWDILTNKPPPHPGRHKDMINKAVHVPMEPHQVAITGDHRINPLGPIRGRVLTETELVDVKAEKLFVFVRGWIRYKSIFGQEHQLNVGALWHPNHDNFIITEHPEYNREWPYWAQEERT